MNDANGDYEVCRAFHWIGQTRLSCDHCGRPEWEHDGWAKPTSAYSFMDSSWELDPWTPEQARRVEECRDAWGRNAIYEKRVRYVNDPWGSGSATKDEVWRFGVDYPAGVVVQPSE